MEEIYLELKFSTAWAFILKNSKENTNVYNLYLNLYSIMYK